MLIFAVWKENVIILPRFHTIRHAISHYLLSPVSRCLWVHSSLSWDFGNTKNCWHTFALFFFFEIALLWYFSIVRDSNPCLETLLHKVIITFIITVFVRIKLGKPSLSIPNRKPFDQMFVKDAFLFYIWYSCITCPHLLVL